jgi:hypothetical protein
MIVVVAGLVTGLLAVLEASLRKALDAGAEFLTTIIDRGVASLETACNWLRAQAAAVIDETSGEGFWGTAVALAMWNMALMVLFTIAEVGLVLLTLRSLGLAEQSGVLPLSTGLLTAIAFLGCSAFFFEMVLELIGFGENVSVWRRGSKRMQRVMLGVALACLFVVISSTVLLAALRGLELESFSTASAGGGGVWRTRWIVLATIGISVAVFVALGLSAWSVKRMFLHVYALLAIAAHGTLAFAAMLSRLLRVVVERGVEIVKAVLSIATAPWRHTLGWLSRYEWIRTSLRLNHSQLGFPEDDRTSSVNGLPEALRRP